MIYNENEVQDLRNHVIELERQLAEAQARISALASPKCDKPRHFETFEKEQQWEEEGARFLANEERLQSALMIAPYPLMIQRDDGRVVMINVAWTEITGYTLEDIPTLAEWTRKAYGEQAPERQSFIHNEGFSQGDIKKWGEFEVTTRLGEKRIWDFSTAPLGLDENGHELVMTMAVDVTDRKSAEEGLRAVCDAAIWLARLPGENPNPVVRVSHEGIVLYHNPPAARLPGWTCAVNEPLPVPLRQIVQEALTQRRIMEQEIAFGTTIYSVSVVPLLDEGYANLYGRDITEQKKVEKALRESEERYRAVVENALDAIIVTDPSRDGKVLSANPAAYRMFGYRFEEFLELDREAVLDASDPRLAVFLQQRHSHGQVTGQLTYKRKDGTRFSGEISSVFYQDKNGEPRALAIIRDITERERAEEALRKSEERFAKAFHASPNAITISQLADGLILEVNEGWKTILGHEQSEALGRTTVELGLYVNPEDREKVIELLNEDGSLRDFELEVRHKSGEVLQMSMSAERLEINNVNCLLTIMQDITARKQFEMALRKRETILAQAGEMAHLGAWDIEFQNQKDVNANPLAWSDEVYRIFGYVPGEVQPSNELFFEHVHPDDRRLVQESVARAIATQQPYMIEHRVRRPDGKERIVQEHAEVFFDETNRPLRIVGAVQDITERKHAEEALRESEERFRSLANSMPQLVWTALQDGTVDYYNSRAQEYWGITQVMATVWEWAPVLYPDDLQTTVGAWRHSVETGEIYQIEHRVRMADGSYRWHLSRGVPVLNEKGRIIRWFGTATDIHDLKRAEEQLKVYAERLEQSNQELEQFAFMASHDLQEPLRKIEVFGDLLLESSKSLGGRERNYLDRMRGAARRMRDMVEGLLQLSRVTTQGKPFIRVNLSQVTSDVLHDLEDQIRRTDGKVEVGSLPVIEGDPLQLRQLIQNLIGNALKYHPAEMPPEVKVYAKQHAREVQIFVEDRGIGFNREDAERIFQPFQRLVGRSQYEGSGMGLAICRRIVERHNGGIVALSNLGDGATFLVTLPMYQSDNAGKEASREDPGTTPGR